MGNHRLRQTMIQLAWLWPIHQPNSALTRWYLEADQGRDQAAEEEDGRRALARKLLVALWRYVDAGVVIEGRRAEAPRRPGRAESLREEANVFSQTLAEVRSTSVDVRVERTDGLLGLKSRSEEGTRPPEPTACESRNQGAVAETRRPNVRLFPAIDQNASRKARPRIEGFEQPEAETHETLKSTRSAQSTPTPADRRALDLMFVRLLGGSGPSRARHARRLRRASPLDSPEPPEKIGFHELDGRSPPV